MNFPQTIRSRKHLRITGLWLGMTFVKEILIIQSLKHRGTNCLDVTVDEIFDLIHTEHLSTGHGARDISNYKMKESYANVTNEVIQLYVDMYETCSLKQRKVRKSLVIKPIVSNAMNSRRHLDLIDMQSQPDGDYKWIWYIKIILRNLLSFGHKKRNSDRARRGFSFGQLLKQKYGSH